MSNTHRRRERGYAFETYIVDFFTKKNWFARRLGGSSTGLPDVVCNISFEIESDVQGDNGITNYDNAGWLFAFECKSSTGNHAYIDNDQLVRCNEVIKGWNLYEGHIVAAFKFMRIGPRDKKTGENVKRKLKYYFFMFNSIENIDNLKNLRCTYEGNLSIIRYDQDIPVTAEFTKYEKIEDLEKFDNK